MSSSETDPRDPTGLPLDDLEVLFENTFNDLALRGEALSKEKAQNIASNTPFSDANSKAFHSASQNISQQKIESTEKAYKDQDKKAKTSLRMKYEAEVRAFCKRQGSLEEIRRNLGLSKRKICQLLLVDPSAWTRWTKQDGEAPPHIYRALEWYLLLQEKHPEYKSSLWLNAVARPTLSKQEVDSIKSELIESSRTELTKKALFYLKEEDLKRDKLSFEMRSQLKLFHQQRRWFFLFLGLQILSLLAFIIFYQMRR